nr:serine hydrolase [Hephaestia mangrovi]
MIVLQSGSRLVEENWPAPDSPEFVPFVHGETMEGDLLEDVASLQKSIVAVLVAIAIEKKLIDVALPVSAYLGGGWSRASSGQESAIRVVDLLTMTSGLGETLGYEAPPGSRFFYNTPAYAKIASILTAAAGVPLDQITHDWLTAPLAMNNTSWRERPAALANVGNARGLVTTAYDLATFGEMILAGGPGRNGQRVVSSSTLRPVFERSARNPAYGWLWWLNGGEQMIDVRSNHRLGSLIAAAPRDLVGAFGHLDRRVYVVPSRDLVVVRTGAAAADADFDQQIWLRLNEVIG